MANSSLTTQVIRKSGSSKFRFARYGFELLTIYWVLRFFLKPDGFNVENIAMSFFFALSLTAFFFQIYIGKKRNQTYRELDSISQILFFFLLLVSAAAWLRGISGSPKQILTLLFNPIVGGAVWLMPLFVLIGTQKGMLEALLPSFRRHAVYGIVFSLAALVFFQLGERDLATSATKSAHILSYAAYFILLAGLGGKTYRAPFWMALLAVSLCHLLAENRLHFIIGLSVLVGSLIFGKARKKSRIWLRSIGVLGFSIPAAFLAFQLSSLTLPESWQTDSRSFLFYELADDFSDKDFIIGRGALGGYFSEYFYGLQSAGIEGGDASFRQVSEVGYLHIVIKAGLIGVSAIVLLMIRVLYLASHLGDYRLTFGVACFFLLQIFAMFVGYHLALDPFHVFTYLIVGWTISEAKRNRVLIRQ